MLDKVKAALFSLRIGSCLRQAIMCCRKAGTISIPGVYVGMGDKIPFGAAMNKGLTIKIGQTHVQAYTKPLLDKIEGERSIRALSLPIRRIWKTRRRCTRNSAIRKGRHQGRAEAGLTRVHLT